MDTITGAELEALQEAMDQDGAQLSVIGSQIAQEAIAMTLPAATKIRKMQDKLIRSLAKHQVTAGNALNVIETQLLNSLNQWQNEAELLLQNIGVKAGMMGLGEPITAALANETAAAPQLQAVGTLVLAVKEAVPYLERLISVLEEIRDRMPGLPVHIKGEPGDAEKDEDTIDLESTIVGDTIPIDWPVV